MKQRSSFARLVIALIFALASSALPNYSQAQTNCPVTGNAPCAVVDLHTPLDNFGDPDLFDDRIVLAWTKPSDNGFQISGYLIAVTNDLSAWRDPVLVDAEKETYEIKSLKPAQALYVRIAAINSAGTGPWSNAFLGFTSGLVSTRVTVLDESGLPITGGAITWAMDDGSAKSTITYGLTADGIIQFPGAPAGRVTISLVNGEMSDGTLVSGTWNPILGLKPAILSVPNPPMPSKHIVRVVLGNSLPLSNVAISFSQLDGIRTRIGDGTFDYRIPKISENSGLTNTKGEFSITGFIDSNPFVTAEYDDGVIAQTRSGFTNGPLTIIKLRSLPFATFDSSSVQGSLGEPIPVVVSAGFGTASSLRAFRNSHLGRSKALGSSGVKVTLIPPAGAKLTSCSSKKVKPVLSALTNSSGKAKLLVCPTRSGVYTLKTKGALSVGSVNMLVKGAAPFAVNSVTVKCPVPGQVHASWNKPIFDGGAPVTKYVVTLSAPGKKTVTKTLAAKLNPKGKVLKAPATVLDLSGLANATTYKVSIVAFTNNGSSDPYLTTIPVA